MTHATFSERLRIAMDRAGLPQGQVARKISYPPSNMTRWLTGHCEPNSAALRRLCKVLDVSADWLLGLTDRIEVQR